MKSVFLSGTINEKAADEITASLKNLVESGEQEILIEIDSNGGETTPTLKLIERTKAWEALGIKFHLIIKDAKSCAAIFALSIGATRKIHSGGSISLHKGGLNLEASDFDTKTWTINPNLRVLFMEYTKALEAVLTMHKIAQHKKLMLSFEAFNWLVLSDKTCQQLGIVSEII